MANDLAAKRAAAKLAIKREMAKQKAEALRAEAEGVPPTPNQPWEGTRWAAQATGATVGSVLGTAGGLAVGNLPGAVAGGLAGEGLGAAAGEEAWQFMNRASGVQDTRPWSQRVKDDAFAGATAAGGSVVMQGVGAAVRGGLRVLGRGSPKSAGQMRQRIEDFNVAGGATPTLGQASQSHPVQMFEATFGNTPGGAAVIANEAQDTINRFEAKVLGTADELGSGFVSPEEGGARINQGITNYSEWYKRKGGQLERQWETELFQKSPDFGVAPNRTQMKLDEWSNKYEGYEATKIFENPLIGKLNTALGNDTLQNQYGEMPIGAIQTIRTQIGRKLATFDMTPDVPRGEMLAMYRSLTEDIQDAFVRNGVDPAIAKKFTESKAFWAENIQRMDNFLAGLAKKGIEPEKLFTALETSGKSGATLLRTVRNSVSPDDWAIFVSGVLRRMGKPTPGRETYSDTFSINEYLSSWNSYSPEAKSALFDGHPQLAMMRKDLDTLARVAGDIRQSGKIWDNPSGTSRMIGSTAGVIGLGAVPMAALGLTSYSMEILGLLGAGYATSWAGAKLATYTPFVHWLARSTKIAPTGMGAHIGRLSALAATADPETRDAIKLFLENMRDGAVGAMNQPPEVPKGTE
jgi:hypothetical protein